MIQNHCRQRMFISYVATKHVNVLRKVWKFSHQIIQSNEHVGRVLPHQCQHQLNVVLFQLRSRQHLLENCDFRFGQITNLFYFFLRIFIIFMHQRRAALLQQTSPYFTQIFLSVR
jgi:hypothetical protein